MTNAFVPMTYTYDEFKAEYGELIFGGYQPKRALDTVREQLSEAGFYLKTGMQIKKNGVKGNGFLIQRIDAFEPEQVPIS